MYKQYNFNKIYLSCRRGILELDIILLNFLEDQYFILDDSMQKKFIYLLNESDQNLYSWIVKGVENEMFIDILYKIRLNSQKMKFN